MSKSDMRTSETNESDDNVMQTILAFITIPLLIALILYLLMLISRMI